MVTAVCKTVAIRNFSTQFFKVNFVINFSHPMCVCLLVTNLSPAQDIVGCPSVSSVADALLTGWLALEYPASCLCVFTL